MAISLENAQAILMERTRTCHPIRLPLMYCCSRVLAEDVMSRIAFPPFTRSPLDGYAVRKEDIHRASPERPVYLRQVEYVPAGAWPRRIIGTNETARVMTGAKVPEGANTVVRLEDTFLDDDQVAIQVSQQESRNICLEGEEYSPGDVVLNKGTYLQEGAMGVLAMMGRSKLKIYSKPRVGILATGSELLSVSTPLQPGKIHDTNSYMLDAKVRLSGGMPVMMGHVEDDVEAIIERLYSAPRLSVYIITGGASIGDYDLAAKVFERLQVSALFDQVAMKPGMPVLAGVWHGSLLIALSGNPAACSVSFEVLVRPLIRKMAGFKCWEHTKVMVKLSEPFAKPSPQRRFVWARCFEKKGAILAAPLSHQGNGMLRSILEANALLDIPAGSPSLQEGKKVKALLIQSWF